MARYFNLKPELLLVKTCLERSASFFKEKE
jgi:hypothetical protein